MNTKAVTDNKEKQKSKKKKDPLEITIKKLAKLQFGDQDLTGEDIEAYVDALAGAKKAMAAIEKTVDEAEEILRAAMRRQWCEHFTKTGHMPELRRSIGSTGSCKVVQQKMAKVTIDKVKDLLENYNIDLKAHAEKNTYTIRMGNASKQATEQIIGSLKIILGEDYDDIVSEYLSVGEKFFVSYDDILKKSLGEDEVLVDKMLSVLRVLKPTIQFSEWNSDLDEGSGFDMAYEFAQISAQRKQAAKIAKAKAKKKKKTKTKKKA